MSVKMFAFSVTAGLPLAQGATTRPSPAPTPGIWQARAQSLGLYRPGLTTFTKFAPSTRSFQESCMNLLLRPLVAVPGILSTLLIFAGASSQAQTVAPSHDTMKQTLLRQPLHFETTAEGSMSSHGMGSKVRIDEGGSVIFGDPDKNAISVLLDGANPQATPVGQDELVGRSNYLLGNDRAKWRTGVVQFSKVQVPAIYPGVDLVYYGNGEQLEHDYILAANADPDLIRMQFHGASARLDARTGDLVLQRPGSSEDTVRLERPVAYQLSQNGTRQDVAASYRLRADGEAQFALGDYDHARPLIIDPVIVYGSYFGGKYNDSIVDLKVGSDGSFYLLLTTDSTDFKTPGATSGACAGQCGPANSDVGTSTRPDMYIAKLDSTAQTLLFGTYLGGSDSDQAFNLALDTGGSIYVYGTSRSADFPIVNGFPGGAPVAGGSVAGTLTKLSADGSKILYSTFIGYGLPLPESPSQVGNAAAHAMVTRGTDNVYLIGQAGATDAAFIWQTYPIFNVGADFVARLDTSQTGANSIVFATRVGDSDISSGAQLTSVAVDSQANVWLYGETKNSAFPVTSGDALQAKCNTSAGSLPYRFAIPQQIAATPDLCLSSFLMELDPNGVVVEYATYLGGSGGNNVTSFDMQLDSADTIYVSGYTDQTNFPILNGAYTTLPNGAMNYISKIAAGGKTLLYSTYVQSDIFSVTPDGRLAYAIASGPGFPLLNNLQTTAPVGGHLDAAFGLLDTTQSGANSLLISSYLGATTGSTQPQRVYLASSGQIVIMGETTATDLPLTNAYQAASAGGTYDGFLAIVQPYTTLVANPTSLTFPATAVGAASGTMHATFTNGTSQMVYLQETLSDSKNFTSISTCGIVQAGKSCTITFTFTPQTTGTLTATYSIAPMGNPAGAVQIALSGTGTGGATATLSPGTLNFGNVPAGSPKSSSVTLTNSGNVALAITSATVTGTGFTLAQNQCGTSLAANSSCQFSITVSSTGTSVLNGTLTVVDASGTQIVALTATGTATISDSLSPSTLDLGVATQSQAALGIVTFTNSGTQPITIQGMTITPQVFTVSRSTCPTPVPAQSSCSIYIQFFPNGLGTVTGTFTLQDGGSNPSVALTATGIADPGGTVTLLPNLLSFTNVAPGQTTDYQFTTLTNGSSTPLTFTFSQITIAGPDAASFQAAVNNCDLGSGCNPVYATSDATFTVSPGGTFQLGVRMLNDAQDLKTYTGTVSIRWNYVGASTSNTLTTSLTGNTATAAAPSVTPGSILFPITANGQTSAAQTVIVSNGGETPLGLTSVTLTGTNAGSFTQSNSCPKSFNKGDTCTISVVFAPGATGTAFTANLDVKLSTGDINVTLAGNTTSSDFTVTSPTTSAQSNPDASWTIDIAPLLASVAWNQPVTLTANGLEPYGKATFTPATVTPGNATAISTLTLAPLTASMQRPRFGPSQNWPVLACFGLCLPFLWKFKSIRSRKPLIVLLCLVVGGSLSGCGDRKPAVTFTVTATSGSVTHMITLTYQP
jgi:hypothetical protein